MPTLIMNDRSIAGLRSTARTTYFDRKTTGLALRVGAKTRAWYFTYRNGGATEWLKLGTYPAVGLKEARTLALDARHAVDIDGVDPAAERRKGPAPEPEPPAAAFTFADFVPAFVAFQRGRTSDWANEEAKIRRHLLPAWGPLPLKSLTRTHVHERLDALSGKGLTLGVNRVQALISRIFTVALDRQFIDAHPAARVIKRFSEAPRDRVLSDDELRTLWAGLDAQPGAASDAMRLRLLLGQRGADTAGMQWSELDLETATWTLPRPRTKTKQPHVVGLSPTALALLARRHAEKSEQETHVFPGLTLIGVAHKALATIHNGAYEWKDLRRTVATRLADLGFDETVIGRTLNHAKHTLPRSTTTRIVTATKSSRRSQRGTSSFNASCATSRKHGRASCRCVPAPDMAQHVLSENVGPVPADIHGLVERELVRAERTLAAAKTERAAVPPDGRKTIFVHPGSRSVQIAVPTTLRRRRCRCRSARQGCPQVWLDR